MSWINCYNIVTSPYRTYIQIPSHEIGSFKFEMKDVVYESLSYAFIPDSPSNRVHIEQVMRDKGILIRFKTDYWPRLEEDSWQKLNNIRKHSSV